MKKNRTIFKKRFSEVDRNINIFTYTKYKRVSLYHSIPSQIDGDNIYFFLFICQNSTDLLYFFYLDLTELGIDYIDVVILSIPPFLNAETQFPVIKPMWKVLLFMPLCDTLFCV